MKSALSPNSFEAPSWLALNASTLMVWVAISLIVVETFSGALRYVLDLASLGALLYVPKALCVLLAGLALTRLKIQRLFWFLLLALLLSTGLGLLHGGSLKNPAFSVFMYIPLLFGLVCGEHLEQRKRLLCWVIALCLLASIGGVLLDMSMPLPWKGYLYNLGDQQLSGNTAWNADGIDRPGGFARMSTTAAMLIALFTLFLAAFTRSRGLLLAMFLVAATAIVLTTNKSTAAAFLLTVPLLVLANYRLASGVIFTLVVLIGVGLPLTSLLVNLDPGLASSGNAGMLSSLYDRMINTWPDLVRNLDARGWSLQGAGFGLVGSTVGLFPLDQTLPVIADNTAVYLWAQFGLTGLLLYLMLLGLLMRLREKNSWMGRGLLNMTFCIIIVSWTTDVMEVSICNLFLGMAIAHALRRRAIPGSELITERRRTDRENYPDGLRLT